jgi:hypothetical protein
MGGPGCAAGASAPCGRADRHADRGDAGRVVISAARPRRCVMIGQGSSFRSGNSLLRSERPSLASEIRLTLDSDILNRWAIDNSVEPFSRSLWISATLAPGKVSFHRLNTGAFVIVAAIWWSAEQFSLPLVPKRFAVIERRNPAIAILERPAALSLRNEASCTSMTPAKNEY